MTRPVSPAFSPNQLTIQSSSAMAKVAAPAGQCPACSHPITTKDEWCKWCHWPVNRKP